MAYDDLLQPKKRKATIGVIILWIVTSALAILSIVALRSVIIRTYIRFTPLDLGTVQTNDSLSLINIIILIPLGILGVAIIIGGAEYHRLRIGKPESWRLFGQTLAVELGILLLDLFL